MPGKGQNKEQEIFLVMLRAEYSHNTIKGDIEAKLQRELRFNVSTIFYYILFTPDSVSSEPG